MKKKNIYFNKISFWICKKSIGNYEEKVRDHCHLTDKFRGAAHWDCSINFQLTKKVSVKYHTLRGYNNHLIFNKLDKFDVKIDVIPDELEKHMTFFFLDKKLLFIDSMRFMNFNLDKLDKNMSNKDFKYLVEELGSKNLELLKQKGAYPYEYMNSFQRINEKKITC